MARNTVMKLWTAVVTAFLALCTTLGLITTTATAAVPQDEPARKQNESARDTHATVTLPAQQSKRWDRSLPPTMKQRIHAEAHGSAPSCRHCSRLEDIDSAAPAAHDAAALRALETEATATGRSTTVRHAPDTPPSEPRHPLQR